MSKLKGLYSHQKNTQQKHTQHKALFLDRDGVINVDHGYVGHYDNFDYVEGIFDVVRMYALAKYKIVIVTNQSGIARGRYTEADFHVLMNRVKQDFFYLVLIDLIRMSKSCILWWFIYRVKF